jgi:energy-coupling factor transporter transmembrane protein EcfT
MTTTSLKLIALILFSTVFIFLRNIIFLGLISFTIIAVSVFTMRRGNLMSRLTAVIGISLFVMLFQILFNVSLVVPARLLVGGMTALRLISLSLLVLLFTETTSPSEIVAALSFLPKRASLMITISFSLIPVILQEISAIRVAQKARGASHSLFPILIPLLNRTLTRAEHIAIVLQTRGFD